jgi:hypothetical protein
MDSIRSRGWVPRAQHPTLPRVGQLVGGIDFGCVDKFCVGADRFVCPHGKAPLLAIAYVRQMSNSLCRGGLPRPPAITEFLIAQYARSRGGCLALVPKSPVHTGTTECRWLTLSSPGPRTQHPTSHRVSRLLTEDLLLNKQIRVGDDFRRRIVRFIRPYV